MMRFGFDQPRRVFRVMVDRNLPGCERHTDDGGRLEVRNWDVELQAGVAVGVVGVWQRKKNDVCVFK